MTTKNPKSGIPWFKLGWRVAALIVAIVWICVAVNVKGLWPEQTPTIQSPATKTTPAGTTPVSEIAPEIEAAPSPAPQTTDVDPVEIDFAFLRATGRSRTAPPPYPEEIAALDGKKVVMTGFMSPYDDLNNMKNFLLLEFPTGCFFCAPPPEDELVLVKQDTEEEAMYSFDYLEVEGTFKLGKNLDDDSDDSLFLYIIENADVQTYEP